MESRITEMPQIEMGRILSAYKGKPKTCMCGCAGTYSYVKENQVAAGKNRGYSVDDEDCNDSAVKRILNKMIKNAEKGIEVIDDNIFCLDIGNKRYALYLIGS